MASVPPYPPEEYPVRPDEAQLAETRQTETMPELVVETEAPYQVEPERQAELDALMELIHLPPPNRYDWYDQALTHSSYTYELGLPPKLNYERLEFLGDAVLKLAISDYLYQRFPRYREGDLTKIRAVVVSDAILAKLAERIELGHYLVMGAAEARSGGAKKSSNLACAFEALLGALYLDGRQREAQLLLEDLLHDIITEVDLSKTKDNYKAALQEFTQGEGMGLPEYVVKEEKGPSHNKTFFIAVEIEGEVMGFGQGKTKKEAQQAAAKTALEALGHLDEEN